MQAIKHLYLYILLALIPSTIQATSTLATIDQCLNFIHLAEVQDRQCKAIFHYWISKDIERQIVSYLTLSERSSMRRVSSSCYNRIESIDYQQLLMQVNNRKVVPLDDKTIKTLRSGDCGAMLSFFFHKSHPLSHVNSKIPWLSIFTKVFPNHLFECFEQRYDDLDGSMIYHSRYHKAFVLAFYKTKGLSKNEFPRLSSDMFSLFKYLSWWDLSFGLKCSKNYLDDKMAIYITDYFILTSESKVNFDQLKQYLAIAYKAGYLLLFGQMMIEDSCCFRKIANICLQNKQQGKQLLGEISYVNFCHNATQESMVKYDEIGKYIKGLKYMYQNIQVHNRVYETYNAMDEVLSQLPKYKSLSLLTSVVAGLYKK